MENNVKITVFTASYNRVEYLKKLYRSLTKQSEKCFEWLIVDDESTDATKEWIESIRKKAPFEVRYYIQKHGGKHRAINKALKLAKGSYFFIVDSDDYLLPNAILFVINRIKDIDSSNSFAGLSACCMDSKKRRIGKYPRLIFRNYVDCSNLKRYRKKLSGDKSEIYKTSVLKQFPFPEYKGEYFVTERLIWDRIAAAGYKIRWYPKVIYVRDYLESGLTKSGANGLKGHLNNYNAYIDFIRQSMNFMETMEFISYFREYNKVAKLKNMSLRKRASEIGISSFEYISYFIKMPFYYCLRKIIIK